MARINFTDGQLDPSGSGIGVKITTDATGISRFEDKTQWVTGREPTPHSAAIMNQLLQRDDLLLADIEVKDYAYRVDIEGLDIIRDGGIYDFDIYSYNMDSSSVDFFINNSDIYAYQYATHKWENNIGSTGSQVFQASTIKIPTGWEEGALSRISGSVMLAGSRMTVICNSGSVSKADNMSRLSLLFGGISETIENITSITFSALFYSGTVIKLYRR